MTPGRRSKTKEIPGAPIFQSDEGDSGVGDEEGNDGSGDEGDDGSGDEQTEESPEPETGSMEALFNVNSGGGSLAE